jgi:tRNA/rRNA methyltransferase
MDIVFILADTAVPENIGASARAIHTMGFTRLRLVNPLQFPDEKAFRLAYGSRQILEQATIHPGLQEALADIDLAIATSMKKRSVRTDSHHIQTLPGILAKKKRSVGRAAVVFGGEESGLSNGQVALCDLISHIPMKQRYPSLNLSHAVMLYAYVLSPFSTVRLKQPAGPAPGKQRQMARLAHMAMDATGIKKNVNLYARILERLSLLCDDDVNLVLSFLDKLENMNFPSASETV